MLSSFKNKIIDKATNTVITVLKRDITMLLGTDARPEDVKVITEYFDEGAALANVKVALSAAGIL